MWNKTFSAYSRIKKYYWRTRLRKNWLNLKKFSKLRKNKTVRILMSRNNNWKRIKNFINFRKKLNINLVFGN